MDSSKPPRSRAGGPKSTGAPDPGAFLDPWCHGCLIRYLAWLRQAYGALPLPPPSAAVGAVGLSAGVPLGELFVQPRLARSQGAPRSLDLFDLLDKHRQSVILGGPGSGRSTLLAWLVYGLTDPGKNPVIDRLGRMVPILVPVRALALDDAARTFPALLERLAELPFWYPGMTETLQLLTERGQALFVVDDLDYPIDPGVAEALREALLDGLWRHGRCTWLFTAEARRYASCPLVMDGVDPQRCPPALQGLLQGRHLAVPAWHLEAFSTDAIAAYAHRWLALAFPGQAAEKVEDFTEALQDSPKARECAGLPGMLALLALVYTARGDIPPDRSTLIDWLVASWMAVLESAPGAHAVPVAARRTWVEALAREAEAARVAATRRKEGFDQQHSPATFVETPTVSYARAVALLQRVVRESGAPDPGEPAAQRFVQAVSVRPGILIGRGDGLSFIRPDHQRFLAALHLAADLGASDDQATTAEAALSTLRSWSNLETAQDDMVELFGILGESGALVERVGRRILGDGKDRSLDELAELAPIALALQENGRDVPPALRGAARALVDDAVERWAVERHKLPPWTRDLAPIAEHIDLEQLDLSGCTAIKDLGPLRGLTRLERLEMRDCAAVTDVGPLAGIEALKWADLRGCTAVADIAPLSHLPVLRWLDLGGCTGLTDLSSLGRLPHLQALVLHGCTGLQDLKAIGAIRSLRYLVISDCPNLKDLRPLRVLPSGGTVWVQGSGVRWVPPDLRWTVKGLER